MGLLVFILLAVIVLFIVGGFVVGLTIKLLWWVLVGVVIGALARLILPGRQAIGWLGTALCGIAGSLLGGIIGDVIGVGSLLQFVLAVIVAIVLVAIFGGTRAGARG
jgi:uncharacterized membrane protein YeaQ/YmgE (transglycosylase-associated protein family)